MRCIVVRFEEKSWGADPLTKSVNRDQSGDHFDVLSAYRNVH